MPGLDVGRVEGDYLHELGLVDVDVRDDGARRRPRRRRSRALFLLPLLQRLVAVSELRVEGARVDARATPRAAQPRRPRAPAPRPKAARRPQSGAEPVARPRRPRLVDGAGTLEAADGGRPRTSRRSCSSRASPGGRRRARARRTARAERSDAGTPVAAGNAPRRRAAPTERRPSATTTSTSTAGRRARSRVARAGPARAVLLRRRARSRHCRSRPVGPAAAVARAAPLGAPRGHRASGGAHLDADDARARAGRSRTWTRGSIGLTLRRRPRRRDRASTPPTPA